MNIINYSDINPDESIISIDDLAMFLNLFYHELVDTILEYIVEYNDVELIQEIINQENLPFTGVVYDGEIAGYIHGGSA